MVDVNRLKGAIVTSGKNQQMIAEQIGIDKSTFYRKMKNGGDFSVGEASRIAEVIPLSSSEAIAIFFSGKVAQTRHTQKS